MSVNVNHVDVSTCHPGRGAEPKIRIEIEVDSEGEAVERLGAEGAIELAEEIKGIAEAIIRERSRRVA